MFLHVCGADWFARDEIFRRCVRRSGSGRNMAAPWQPVGAVGTREGSEHLADALVRDLEREILKAVATGRPLSETMDLLCRRVEALVPSTLCSVLAVDQNGRLLHLASPSLPEHYSRAIDGVAIGPTAGSCA